MTTATASLGLYFSLWVFSLPKCCIGCLILMRIHLHCAIIHVHGVVHLHRIVIICLSKIIWVRVLRIVYVSMNRRLLVINILIVVSTLLRIDRWTSLVKRVFAITICTFIHVYVTVLHIVVCPILHVIVCPVLHIIVCPVLHMCLLLFFNCIWHDLFFPSLIILNSVLFFFEFLFFLFNFILLELHLFVKIHLKFFPLCLLLLFYLLDVFPLLLFLFFNLIIMFFSNSLLIFQNILSFSIF